MNEESEDLIAEAREACADRRFNGTYEADLIRRLADALEAATGRARQAEAELRDMLRVDIPSLKAERDAAPDSATEELRADEMTANEAIGLVLKRPGMYGLVAKGEHRSMKAERDAARAEIDSRIEDRDYWYGVAATAKDQRDAALAAVERIRRVVSGYPECDRYEEGDVISCGWKSAYASVVAALDGAPEPEWEYRVEYQVPGGETHVTRPRTTFEDAYGFMLENIHGGTVMRRTKAIPAGPWLPVEGESK